MKPDLNHARPPHSQRFVVIGAGVAGLSVARELAGRGLPVTVLEREAGGPGASGASGAATWASLGVLTAPAAGTSPLRRLQRLGHRTYPLLDRELAAETGIDIGYRVRGSLHLRAELPPAPQRAKAERAYRDAGIEARWVDGAELRRLAPALDGAGERFRGALHVPGEAIVHPPDLSRALRASAERRGAEVREGAGEVRLAGAGELVVEVQGSEPIAGATVVIAAGAWSRLVPRSGGGPGLPVRPIRGQAIEVRAGWPEGPSLRFEPPGLGREYHLVAKGGGIAWVGSTVEDAGFDASVTGAGLEELLEAARWVLPRVGRESVARAWAGLRPQALRPGGPFLGRLPATRNVWVLCGHYRSGILMGPASARLLVREMLGEDAAADAAGDTAGAPSGDAGDLDRASLAAFRVDR